MKEYYIYLTENLVNGTKYIGKHYGNIDDEYLGSGLIIYQSIQKHGIENFKKKILEIGVKDNIDLLEKKWIKKYNAVKDKNFYNLTDGGTGGKTLYNKKQIQLRTNKFRKYLENLTEEEKKEISKKRSLLAKKQRQNKELDKQRVKRFKQTLSNKSIDWKKERYKNQSGKNHYCARKVNTPDGTFELASDAAKFYNVHTQTILNRCNNKNKKFREWEFIKCEENSNICLMKN